MSHPIHEFETVLKGAFETSVAERAGVVNHIPLVASSTKTEGFVQWIAH